MSASTHTCITAKSRRAGGRLEMKGDGGNHVSTRRPGHSGAVGVD